MKQQTAESNAASKTVMVVDDEALIRSFISTVLVRASFKVLIAASGEHALEQSKDYKDTIDLVLSDIQMPGINGIELGARIAVDRPETKIILMSGYQSGLPNEGWHFLAKPFVASQLLDSVSTVLATPPTPDSDEWPGKT